MAEYADREHYIPLRKGDLVELLLADKGLPPDDRGPFRQFCTLVSAIFHFEYLDRLEKLKDGFAPFDPDAITRPLKPLTDDQRQRRMDELFREFVSLMERANYKHLSRDDVAAAVEGGASDWGLNMAVDWTVFDKLEIFARGEGKSLRTRRHPVLFWKKQEKEVDTYQRLVLVLKLRPHKRLPAAIDTQDVYLKLFKDIPKLDLEMILPGTRIQMPKTQKGKLAGSLLGTIGFAIYKVWTDLLAVFGTLAKGALMTAGSLFWGPLLVLGGYGYKQYYGYQVVKQTYSLQLTESLYFQTLSNNAGVLTQLLDEAEEQECREAILAYFCLSRYAPPSGWTAQQLDDYVEMYLEGNAGLKVDFEIGDALEKVERLGIVERAGDRLKAVPLPVALERLDERWDNYFQYHQAAV
jgi:hypothetical protein